MTAEEARKKIDQMIANGVLNRTGVTSAEQAACRRERAELDKLYSIAFASEKPSYVTNMNTPKVWTSEGKSISNDFYPTPIAAIVTESEKVIQKNEARRLLAEIYSRAGDRTHPYFNDLDPEHTAWVNAITVITELAGDE